MSWKIDGVYSPVVDLFHELFIMMLYCGKGFTLVSPFERLHTVVENLIVVDWEEHCYLESIDLYGKGER